MALTRIVPGALHRASAPLELDVHDYDAVAGRRAPLERFDVFQPWTPVQEHWRGQHVPITPGFGSREFSWGITSLDGYFMRWDDYFERCELAGTRVSDGHVTALVAKAVGFALEGELLDVDSGLHSRDGSRFLGLAHALKVAEVLATGQSRVVDETYGERPWRLEWTLEAPDEWPQSADPATQRLWFFPIAEDWCAFQLRCRSLIDGLSAESRWLLSVLEPAREERAQVEALLVLLDQAMVRCGIAG